LSGLSFPIILKESGADQQKIFLENMFAATPASHASYVRASPLQLQVMREHNNPVHYCPYNSRARGCSL